MGSHCSISKAKVVSDCFPDPRGLPVAGQTLAHSRPRRGRRGLGALPLILGAMAMPLAAEDVTPEQVAPSDTAIQSAPDRSLPIGSDQDDADPATRAGVTTAELADAPSAWTLEQLVDRALRTNPRVLGQQEGVAVAQAGVSAARWEYFATPQVQVESTRDDRLITSSLTQPLYAFGRIGATMAAARAQARAADFRTHESRRDIALRVLELYGQFTSVSRQIEVLGADIERHLDLEAMIHRRVDSGLSAPVDLNLVQTRLNQSRILRITLRARQRAALAALTQIVGVPLAAGNVQVARLPDQAGGPGSEALPGALFVDQPGNGDLVQRCLDHNPALQRAEAEVAVTEAEARRARSTMFPTIVARLENRSFTSGYPGNGLPDTRFTIGLTLNTGAGLSALAGVSAAQARTRVATLNRAALRQDVTSTVISALETFAAARKSVDALRQNRLVQEQTAQSYNRMFLAGKRSWLDLLNMVREQSTIERDLADAEVQLFVADYRLRIEAGDVA